MRLRNSEMDKHLLNTLRIFSKLQQMLCECLASEVIDFDGLPVSREDLINAMGDVNLYLITAIRMQEQKK